jgi:hypothetical protein
MCVAFEDFDSLNLSGDVDSMETALQGLVTPMPARRLSRKIKQSAASTIKTVNQGAIPGPTAAS